MKNYQRLKGLIAATFTPMKTNGSIDLSVIKKYSRLLVNSGVSGVFVCGTSGESASLTIEERKSITEAWIKSTKEEMRIIIHVGHNSQPAAIELAEHAQKAGADGIAAIAPGFFKPSSVKNLIDFFAPIAKSADELPFYYYNMPSITGVNLSVAQFLQEGIKQIPNLAGTKFTHDNLMEMGECLSLENGSFEVLNGYDEMLLGGLVFGAIAGVGSTYNYVPKVYLNVIDAMKKNDLPSARMWQMKSIEIVKILIKYGGGVRAGKAIMKLIGLDCGQCRLPIAPFCEEEYQSLYEDLNKIDFFDNCLNVQFRVSE